MAHEDQLKKLVSLDKLGLYHHTLLEKLGLVNDTAAFQYNGARSDFDSAFPGGEGELDPTKINDVVSGIYDLAKAGSISFADGKAEDADKTVSFTEDDEETGNLYYINAKVGDETVNIKLDASDFVKDSFLEKVEIVTVIKDEEGNITYKVGDSEPSATAPTGFDKTDAGTYFFYTWKENHGEEDPTYNYTAISVKDIYGDLEGDDYITVKDGKISANTAEVNAVNDSSDSSIIVSWEVSSDADSSNLATAENLASVASSLQEQLNEAKKALTLNDGDVTLSENDENALEVVEDTEGIHYALTLQVASSDDITDLFVECK